MSKRTIGKRPPVKYQESFYCKIINKTVVLNVEELIDGHPAVTQWKKLLSCNCNSTCNPNDPATFPRQCPALKLQISRLR